MDIGWPARAGAEWHRGLSDAGLCVLARADGQPAGRLRTSEIRPGATIAVLATMRVEKTARRSGLGFYRSHGFTPFELTLRRG